MNVHSDSSQSALKYLKDTEANINNVLIITRDFNIRDRLCVIRRECGQTLGLGLVDRNRTVVNY